MRLLLNLLWIVLGGGLLLWLQYVLAGLALCLTIVGIPFGIQCFKLGGLALLPFGKDLRLLPAGGGALELVFNLIWFFVGGVWIFLTHVVLALGLVVTIVGIPFAVQHTKLAVLALWPFGRGAAVP
jgi:uncharacterized membrane protein YccF (DUF307 family)